MALIEVGDKKVEIKDLTQRDRKTIQGYAYKTFKEPEYILLMNLDIVTLATGLNRKDVGDKYTDQEVNLLADEIAKKSIALSEEKKKD